MYLEVKRKVLGMVYPYDTLNGRRTARLDTHGPPCPMDALLGRMQKIVIRNNVVCHLSSPMSTTCVYMYIHVYKYHNVDCSVLEIQSIPKCTVSLCIWRNR